ncbi:hypothetical protein PVAND_014886 [Polypedilum vanderplanki]|uniref:Uncharacterized protein n=1 Tax=Polypedilum vanderplanki TaxID=319348 RepID=A0A9J6BBB1_POLVA|nr:hypothetical protein PVAND_014886 [Polypedilum vanderplanki]
MFSPFSKRRPENYKEIKNQIKIHKENKPINITFNGSSSDLNKIFQFKGICKAFNKNSNTNSIIFKLDRNFENFHFKNFVVNIKRPFVIGVYSDEKILIFWKIEKGEIHQYEISNGIINFHNHQIGKVCSFITEKLEICIRNGHEALGIKSANIQNTTNDNEASLKCSKFQKKSIEIHNIILNNKENLLTSAINENNLEVLKFLISSKKFNINDNICFINDEFITPAQLACSLHLPKIFLLLLENNSMFPENYKIYRKDFEEECEKLKILVKIFEKFHEVIEINNDSDVLKTGENSSPDDKEKIQKFEDLFKACINYTYCFNIENVSLAFHAHKLKKFNLEECLKKRGKRIASHESTKAKEINKEQVNENISNAKKLKNAHVNILISKSYLGKNLKKITSNDENELSTNENKLVTKVFEYLNTIHEVIPILKIIAASGNFKIIFDTRMSDLREFLRLSNNTTYGAVYHKTGNITVSVKELFADEMIKRMNNKDFSFNENLDESVSKIIGILAHELCHYALLLVFQNECRPYAIEDSREFDIMTKKISEKVEKLKRKNLMDENMQLIVESVFYYPKQEWHAELAVRPAQFYAEFSQKEIELAKYKEIFLELFEYFDKILRKFKPTIKIIEEINKPDCKICYEDLTENYKISLKSSKINFQRNLIKIDELLSTNDSKILNDDRISTIGNDKNEVFANNDEKSVINIEISNRILYEILKTMSSKEILQIFNLNQILSIGSEILPPNYLIMKIKNRNPFDVKRNEFYHQNEDSIKNYKIIYNNFAKNELNSLDCEKVKFSDYACILDGNSNEPDEAANETEVFRDDTHINKPDFVMKSPELKIKVLNEISTDVLLDQNFRKVIKAAENKKLLVINDQEGQEKTITLKFITALMNKKRPEKWIIEIDLKVYEDSEITKAEINEIIDPKCDELISKFINFVLKNVLKVKKNSFEANLFENLLYRGQVIIFWDKCLLEEIINIVSVIRNLNIVQFIAVYHCKENEIERAFNDVEIINVAKLTGFVESSDIMQNIIQAIEKIISARNRSKD